MTTEKMLEGYKTGFQQKDTYTKSGRFKYDLS